jgi:nitrogen regulatory protein PII
MSLVLFVLNDPAKLEDVLNAWEEAGVPGITILPSNGLGRIRRGGNYRDDLPLIPGLDSLLEHEETSSHTLFSAIDDEAVVERVVAATFEMVGDLNKPHTGVLLILPIARSYGIQKRQYH